MYDENKTYLNFYGWECTGWTATSVLIAALVVYTATTFYAGWQSGMHHLCGPVS